MNEPDPSWADLLARLESDLESRPEAGPGAAKDEPAWGELLRRVRYYAHAVLQSRVDISVEDREDIAQGVLLKLQSRQALRRVRLSRSPPGYVVAMIRNAANDLSRRERVERTSLGRLQLEALLEAAEHVAEKQDERIAALRKELLLLRPADRTLLRLRFWKKLSFAQIAEELQVPYSTVAVRMFRLLRVLRERLNEQRGMAN